MRCGDVVSEGLEIFCSSVQVLAYRVQKISGARPPLERPSVPARHSPERGYLSRQKFYFLRYLSIAAAAFLPAPIAEITVAAPVTMSPPANTPSIDVI